MVGDRYPGTSWSLAQPVGVLYALQKAAKAKAIKKIVSGIGAGLIAFVERATYFRFSVRRRALSLADQFARPKMMEVKK